MELTRKNQRALANAEKQLRYFKWNFVGITLLTLVLFSVVGWHYGTNIGKQPWMLWLIVPYAIGMAMHAARLRAALRDLTAAFQDVINRDPQALAQQKLAERGESPPDSVLP